MLGAVVLFAATARIASADSNCAGTSVGLVPINELGAGLYLGRYQGGLYPNGLDSPPPGHLAEGVARARRIQPLDSLGRPDPSGKIVLMALGFSNTTQEFCSHDSLEPCDPWTFMGQAADHPAVNRESLVMVDAAIPGQDPFAWDSPDDPNYGRVREEKLAPKGLTELQVQTVWLKEANREPPLSLPDPNADAFALEASLADIARAIKVRYPNCLILFVSSRTYAGYASSRLNPEPFAYESAFSVKWLIEAQIKQMALSAFDPITGNLDYTSAVPFLAWGPYFWADGLIPREDGLRWECLDFQGNDGTHPSTSGETKAATQLLTFMLQSPFAIPWFRSGVGPASIPAVSTWGAVIMGSLMLTAGTLLGSKRRPLSQSRLGH